MDGRIWSEIGARLGRAAGAARAFARAHPLRVTLAATGFASVLALTFPRFDVAVASLFFSGGRFPAEKVAVLVDLRLAGMAVTRIVVVALVLGWLGKLFVPMLSRGLSTRGLMFLSASMALGPGILVNSILKEFWGRPRPWQITDFGGSMSFFPAWVPGGACASNCSFPSGEASSAMWLIALALVAPARWRRATTIAVAGWTLAISLNRMAFGGHFLSDVVIGWGLTATVVFGCGWFFLDRIGPRTEARVDDALARAGERVLRGMRAPAVWFGRAEGPGA